eukprot:COSAG02_NODE_25022_length_671_cov_0.580420_1_plen_44_part_10
MSQLLMTLRMHRSLQVSNHQVRLSLTQTRLTTHRGSRRLQLRRS